MDDDLVAVPGADVTPSDLGARDERGRLRVSSADAVEAILQSRDLAVVAPQLPPRRLAAVVARMARFVEGPDHAAARRVAVDALAAVDLEGARRGCFDLMRAAAARALDADGSADVTSLARRTTTEVLARSLGFTDGHRTVDALLTVARAIAPPEGQPLAGPTAVDQAIDDLDAASPAADATATANLIGLLFQAVDATTGLVTGALWPRSARGTVAPDGGQHPVWIALAHNPPVLSTRRVVARGGRDGLVDVAAGDEIVLLLASAASSSTTAPGARPLAFGAGHHACPGWEHAVAMAIGMVDAVAELTSSGAQLVAPRRDEARANLRIAESLLLTVEEGVGGRPLDGGG